MDPTVSSPPLRVRPLTAADTRFAAELHALALPGGIVPRLGRRGLQTYYQGFVRSPHAIAFTADRDQPVGVVVGAADPDAHRRWIRRHHLRKLVLSATGAILRHPVAVVRFAAQRLGRRGQARTAEPGPGPHTARAVLTHVAVAPTARGTGAGAALVEAFTVAAGRAGRRTVQLVTPVDGGAVEFYDRLGWRRITETVGWDGRRLVHFETDTASPGSE